MAEDAALREVGHPVSRTVRLDCAHSQVAPAGGGSGLVVAPPDVPPPVRVARTVSLRNAAGQPSLFQAVKLSKNDIHNLSYMFPFSADTNLKNSCVPIELMESVDRVCQTELFTDFLKQD